MSKKMQELLELKEQRIKEVRQVLTVKKDDLKLIPKQGYFDVELPKEIKVFFIEKEKAEVSKEYIQIIPTMMYVDTLWKKLLVYQRNSEEKRLTNQWSFLFGGHIEKVDVENILDGIEDFSVSFENFRKIIFTNLRRELMEEIGYFMYIRNVRYPMKPFFVDDNDGVSSKHLCLPFMTLVNFKNQKFVASKEIRNLSHMDFEIAFKKQFESWSQVVMDKFREVFEWI